MLKKLVAFDTVSHKSNMSLISFVQEYLDSYGIASKLIYDTSKKKANLYATIGDANMAGVILSGHTDVVPVEGQDWDSDPFELYENNDIFYGRGTCDMKGFIAVALSNVPKMLKANLNVPIHFALSYDEEIGCIGAHGIAEHIEQLEVKPKFCIVGEPTSMKPITGHKGVCNYHCSVHGKECHSSLAHEGVNAIEYAAELVAYIRSIARRMQKQGPFNQDFNPPFTTMHVGKMKGGTALNIIPNSCEFDVEIRSIPEQDKDDIMAEIKDYAFRHLEPNMKDIDSKTGITLEEMVYTPGFDISNDHECVLLVQNLTGVNHTQKVSFGTEAGIFHAAGVPTIVCGPGSIEQAHKPNEFVTYKQIAKCEHFLSRLIATL